MNIKIEIPTADNSEYSPDIVRIEESRREGYIEFDHEGHTFELRKDELKRALKMLTEEEY